MKKVLMLLGVVLFSASAFALNAEVTGNETCAEMKAAFEKHVDSLEKESFIAQYIVINLADSFQQLTDEQATPLAQCYATYRVKKDTLMVDFVRTHADIFRQKALEAVEEDFKKGNIDDNERYIRLKSILNASVYDELKEEMLGFADRVTNLSK